MSLPLIVIIILLVFVLVAAGAIIKEISNLKQKLAFAGEKVIDNSPLQLQAYERLSLLADRCSLKNLVTRVTVENDSAASLHYALLDEIKNEYNYNITQQIYVTPEVWDAITRMKDQNMYIINQIAATLPEQATAKDLSRRILEFSMHENADLHPVVQQAIQYEAKKLL